MIDGLKITKELNGQQVDLSQLYPTTSWENGGKYKFKGSSYSKYSNDTPTVSVSNGKLNIEGSLPYLIKSNNFIPFNVSEIKQAFIHLSNTLNIDLLDARVNYFEFGTTGQIPFSFKEFIYHHTGLEKMESAYYNNKGKYFRDKLREIKLYDAGYNAKGKLSRPMKGYLNTNGQYSKRAHYVKFEIQFKNPYKYFNRKITVADLMDVDFLGMCAEDLLYTYNKIKKIGFDIPQTPKELTPIKIFAITLKEVEQEIGCDMEARILKRIKTMKVLSYNHRNTRKKSITEAFKGIRTDCASPFDISLLLKQEVENFLNAA